MFFVDVGDPFLSWLTDAQESVLMCQSFKVADFSCVTDYLEEI